MNISLFELEPWQEEYFNTSLGKHKLVFDKKPLTTRNVKKHKDAQAIVLFVFSRVTKKVLDELPKLKFIATMSTGYDHIDIDECKKRGIKVSTVPFYGQNTVAEYAFGLLQALNRNVVEAMRRTRSGNFDYKGLMGRDLDGAVLGVLGTGHIGQFMIKYAKAFNMKVLAYDKFPNKDLETELGFKYVSFEQLCKKSDFISLHLPLVQSTFHILNDEAFSLMKKGVTIINTGRGSLIDTSAFLRALNKKIIGAAALDVLELENDLKKETRISSLGQDKNRLKTLMDNTDLIQRPNVIVTPHLAFYTKQAIERILDTTVKNLKGYISKRYRNKVA